MGEGNGGLRTAPLPSSRWVQAAPRHSRERRIATGAGRTVGGWGRPAVPNEVPLRDDTRCHSGILIRNANPFGLEAAPVAQSLSLVDARAVHTRLRRRAQWATTQPILVE